MNWKSVLTGLALAFFFSCLYAADIFSRMGDQVYDLLLRVRPDRVRTADVVFLDVDDNAIAYNGVFPWPRSVTAEGLLRLKEYGARAAIFDIEYIDAGPQGVDAVYLNTGGLHADFERAFSEINSAAADVMSALKSGRTSLDYIDEYADGLSRLIDDERDNLLARVRTIARDNDQYLIQSSALFGKSWATLNLRSELLSGEQAERRSLAEDNFTYPVDASAGANKGKYIDILPALPGFALAAKGAGFTNVEIDKDGIRRRIDLAQNIHDHWYLQLAFRPLMDYLGNPQIEIDNRKLIIKNAQMPHDAPGNTKRITIPLDGRGRMMLDWPKEDYINSYKHISFYVFSLLENVEAAMERRAWLFGREDIAFFAQFDASLVRIPLITGHLDELFDAIRAAKAAALETGSDEHFAAYVDYRSQSRALIRELLSFEPAAAVNALLPGLIEAYPENEATIAHSALIITTMAEYIQTDLDNYEYISEMIEDMVRDKFCILGRVDTGTTDIGANPFYGEYVNVGTHGVVLDMILSEKFITPIDKYWHILVNLIFVFLFFLVSANFTPVLRAVSGFIVTVTVIVILALLFRLTGLFFNPLLITFSMISAVILREIISYAGSEREKQFIRKAFSTYVSNDVVKEIIADPSRLQLGGAKRHMTAIFTDVKGFSTISEKLEPENLVTLLNHYLTAMSDVILKENGTIDKYEGDAIIAFFGAPLDLPDHALKACISAILMKRIERELNKTIMKDELSALPLFTRIGINTGNMVAGNMGTGNKMNYTIMGNAVNLASRLEGVNKQYGTWILAADDTIRETNGRILTRKLDQVRVVGINKPVRIHELLNTIEDAGAEEKKLVAVFHQALDQFESRNWKEAAEGFRESLSIEIDGGPSEKYLERCRNFLTSPPPDTWDGVYNLTEK